jgi:DNA replication protein DnaC
VPILVLDDFGIDTGTQRHERDFYEIFNKRFGNNLLTIISTNLDDSALYKAYGERIASRLKEAAVIEFNGPDLRG